MVVSHKFVKSVPASEGSVFEVSGGVVTAGLTVILENLSPTNSLVYRMQQSFDRVTWVDVEFQSSGGGTVSQFSIPPTNRHHFKVTYERPYLRMFASGNLQASFEVVHAKASDTSSSGVISIIP